MEAARVAAVRGHKVTLYEKGKELGGMMRYSSVPEFKQDIRDFLQYQIHQLHECGVSVVTGTEVTTKLVQSEKPDAVIVASGARPSRPQIDGINDSGIYDAIDVLGGKIPQEKRVIVCGAGLIGVEVALYLAESHQKKVVLVDMLPTVAPEEMHFAQWVLQARLVEADVDVRLDHCINRISPKSISCTLEGADESIESDAVVVAMGMTADQTFYNELMKLPIEVLAIGDAVKARKILDAVHEGYHAGRRI
jgi:NADPH-dependent 2,4-dienoyl-CoA reductase/sulfur reductase-like enzyme